jgi:hypothetical protein
MKRNEMKHGETHFVDTLLVLDHGSEPANHIEPCVNSNSELTKRIYFPPFGNY